MSRQHSVCLAQWLAVQSRSVAVLPDGKSVVVGDRNHFVRMYRLHVEKVRSGGGGSRQQQRLFTHSVVVGSAMGASRRQAGPTFLQRPARTWHLHGAHRGPEEDAEAARRRGRGGGEQGGAGECAGRLQLEEEEQEEDEEQDDAQEDDGEDLEEEIDEEDLEDR